MKNYIFILVVLMMFGCGRQQSKQITDKDSTNFTVLTDAEPNLSSKSLVWPDSATKIKLGEILDAIHAKCDSYIEVDSLPDFVVQIHLSPDGKYRFYSGNVDTVSQGYDYATYIEFTDLYGNVVKKQWKPNLRSDFTDGHI